MNRITLDGIDRADMARERRALFFEIRFGFAVAGEDHALFGANHEFGWLK